MTMNPEWNDALEMWVIEERERLGGPPSPEDVDAFLRGELPDEEAARVRALLVYYPELTSLLDEVVAPRPRGARLWHYAIAAALAIALSVPIALRVGERHEPTLVLENMHTRGRPVVQVYELPEGKEPYALELSLLDGVSKEYRIEIVDTSRSKVVWRADGERLPLRITVPRRTLRAGTYRIDVFASGGEKTESFWIRTR